jgi:SAM-dependent methyltransferase
MHVSALENGKRFFDTYVAPLQSVTVVDIGSQDVNGSLKSVCPAHAKYIGVDFVAAKGVDVILTDPYKLPFESNSLDAIVSSSCFEHSELFWVLFLEIMRVLKPTGLFYLNVPSNGVFHRYPVDCWRFYPDSGNALASWAKLNGMNTTVLESYTSNQVNKDWRINEDWNDFVAIFVKDQSQASLYPKRVLHSFKDFTNGMVYPKLETILNESARAVAQKKPTPRLRDRLRRRMEKLFGLKRPAR